MRYPQFAERIWKRKFHTENEKFKNPTIVNFGFVSEENSFMQIKRLHHFEKFRVQNNVFCPQENEKLEFSISPRLNRVPKMQFS